MSKKITKVLFLILGIIFLAAAFIGIFIPVLPTTPFLLLTSFCFIRGSERLHKWLINHKVFGEYLNNYIKHRAMTIKSKLFVIILLWISLIISIIAVDNIYVDFLLPLVGIAVSIHILMIKSI